jgi:N-acetyl-gamma-glutamylphosphate reductase
MSKRTVVAGAGWVVLTVLAFLADPILGACVLIFGAIGVVVVQLSSTWDEHPDFEARELVRSRRRKEKWEKNKGPREKDAARYAAYQARKNRAAS